MLDILTALCLHLVNPRMHCRLLPKELSKPCLSPEAEYLGQACPNMAQVPGSSPLKL